MKTIIAGAGETGFNIALELSESKDQQYDVQVIDTESDLLREIQQNLNVAITNGSCTDIATLKKAQVKFTDLFIASTNHDETNLISCMLAKELGAKTTVALVRSNHYQRSKLIRNYERSGVDYILNTTQQIVDEILEVSALNKNATEITTFSERKVTMLSAKISENSKLKDMQLKDTNFQGRYLIGCIIRDEQSFIPGGNDYIRANDLVYFILPTKNMSNIKEDLDLEVMNYHKAVISGEDALSYEVAIGLANSGLQTTIIGKSHQRLEPIIKKNKRENVNLLEGSATNIALLLNADVANSAVFVAMMEDYGNIAACMAAKHLGVQKTIAMINHLDMKEIAEKVGLDVQLSRRLFGVKYVKKILVGKDFDSYTTIGNTSLEVITLDVAEDATATAKKIREISFPANSLVALVIKDDNPIIPNGSTEIEHKDKVVLFTDPNNRDKLRTLFLNA